MTRAAAKWACPTLEEVCEINPRDPGPARHTSLVSFVPMAAVSDTEGAILEHDARPFEEVAKGYTRFREQDVIFAKITPCMENGKIALATNLRSGFACGSTEFHVFRSRGKVVPKYLWYFLRQKDFRVEAEHHMSGAVGQRRVPSQFLKGVKLPLPSPAEQTNIVSKLDSLIGRSKTARAELIKVPRLVERYKQAVLAAAFRGDFTAEWRSANPSVCHSSKFLEARRAFAAELSTRAAVGRDERSAMLDRDSDLAREIEIQTMQKSLPATWEWCGIGEAFGVYVGATPSRKEARFWNGDVPWVSSGEVAFCSISDTKEKITATGLSAASTRPHPVGTVLLGMIGEGKTRGQAAILEVEACNNQNSAAIRVSEARYPSKYLYWFLYAVYERTRTAGSGNNQQALNKGRVQRLLFPLAPPEEAAEIVVAIETRLSRFRSVESELRRADALLDRLEQATLSKAFRGELLTC
jgi:type I restriction enzyme, S subunit